MLVIGCLCLGQLGFEEVKSVKLYCIVNKCDFSMIFRFGI